MERSNAANLGVRALRPHHNGPREAPVSLHSKGLRAALMTAKRRRRKLKAKLHRGLRCSCGGTSLSHLLQRRTTEMLQRQQQRCLDELSSSWPQLGLLPSRLPLHTLLHPSGDLGLPVSQIPAGQQSNILQGHPHCKRAQARLTDSKDTRIRAPCLKGRSPPCLAPAASGPCILAPNVGHERGNREGAMQPIWVPEHYVRHHNGPREAPVSLHSKGLRAALMTVSIMSLLQQREKLAMSQMIISQSQLFKT
ncbi:hypothetical protein QTO34_014134, partial [Cnephaeus nilssonii]